MKHSSVEDEIAIEELVKQWENNGATGNREANAEFFTDDGIRVQGGKYIEGRKQFVTCLAPHKNKKLS